MHVSALLAGQELIIFMTNHHPSNVININEVGKKLSRTILTSLFCLSAELESLCSSDFIPLKFAHGQQYETKAYICFDDRETIIPQSKSKVERHLLF